MWPAVYTQECLEAAQGTIRPLADGSRPKGLRVFQSRWLELLGLAHPVTPLLWWGPVVLYGAYVSLAHDGVVASVGWIVVGFLCWTLFEYLLHRFVFHMPAHDAAGRFRRFMIHGYHHAFPNDRLRLLAPPLMSWTVGPAIYGIERLVFGPRVVWPVFAGTALGYLAYDYIHYYTHHVKPANPIGRWLRSYHLHHHHDKEEARFGVSTPLWDLVFGTYRSLRRPPRRG